MNTFFLSSTFADMHFERDAVQEITLAKVNAVAKEYGQVVSFRDLRWGIDTLDLDSEEGSRKVLEVCLDEIDRCRPPFIVILGERYGWIPEPGLVKSVAESKRMQLEDLKRSVTALEVEYGALRPERAKERALFYFREMEGDPPQIYRSEDAEHAAMLEELKERVRTLTNGQCKTYRVRWRDGKLQGVEKFAEMLAEDVVACMRPTWEKLAARSPLELEREKQWNYIRDRGASFYGRKALLGGCLAAVESGREQIFIKGDTGNGKSMLFCALALALEKRGWEILPYVGGLTTESNDSMDILRNSVAYLEEKLGVDPRFGDDADGSGRPKAHTAAEWRARLGELGSAYAQAGHKLMIMVDGVDRLLADDNRHSLIFIPPCLGENFRFLLTANTSFREIDAGYISVPDLAAEEREEIIDGILGRTGRSLDRAVKEDMVSLPAAGNPLYLSLLIQRLCMMNYEDYTSIRARGDGMRAISDHQREIVASCPKETGALCNRVIEEAGRRINPTLVRRAMQYLAVSNYGLREADLRALVGEEWNVLDFVHFITYMNDSFLLRDDGRYDFSHSALREGVLASLDVAAVNRELLAYFKTIRADEVFPDEIFEHIYLADDKQFLREYTAKIVTDQNLPIGFGEPIAEDHPVFRSCRGLYRLFLERGGEWIAETIDQTPTEERYLAFLEFVLLLPAQSLALFCDPTRSIRIAEAACRFSRRCVEAGVRESENMLVYAAYLLASLYYQAMDPELSKRATELVFECLPYAKKRFEEDRSRASFGYYLAFCRQLPYATGDESYRVRSRKEILSLLEIARGFYEATPDMGTANDLYGAYLILSQEDLLDGDFLAFYSDYREGMRILEPYFGELDEKKGCTTVYGSATAVGNQLLMFFARNNQILRTLQYNGYGYARVKAALDYAAKKHGIPFDVTVIYEYLLNGIPEEEKAGGKKRAYDFSALNAYFGGEPETPEEDEEPEESEESRSSDFAKLNALLANFSKDEDEDFEEDEDGDPEAFDAEDGFDGDFREVKDVYTGRLCADHWREIGKFCERAEARFGRRWKAGVLAAHAYVGTVLDLMDEIEEAAVELQEALRIAGSINMESCSDDDRVLYTKCKALLARVRYRQKDMQTAFRYASEARLEAENLSATYEGTSSLENLCVSYSILFQLLGDDPDLCSREEGRQIVMQGAGRFEQSPLLAQMLQADIPLLYLCGAKYLIMGDRTEEDDALCRKLCGRAREILLQRKGEMIAETWLLLIDEIFDLLGD